MLLNVSGSGGLPVPARLDECWKTAKYFLLSAFCQDSFRQLQAWAGILQTRPLKGAGGRRPWLHGVKHSSSGNVMRNRASGFTIIELLITISIVGILAAIALPAYQSMVVGTRVSGELNALIGAMNVARSEAQKRGATISLCPGTTTTCGTDWSAGWVVALEGAAQPLLTRPVLVSGDTIMIWPATAGYPKFNAAGYTFFNGKISVHDKNNTPALRRCVVIAAGTWTTTKGALCP